MCPKTLATPGNMRRHLRGHLNERPFACGYCSLRFPDSSNRKRHVAICRLLPRPRPVVNYQEAYDAVQAPAPRDASSLKLNAAQTVSMFKPKFKLKQLEGRRARNLASASPTSTNTTSTACPNLKSVLPDAGGRPAGLDDATHQVTGFLAPEIWTVPLHHAAACANSTGQTVCHDHEALATAPVLPYAELPPGTAMCLSTQNVMLPLPKAMYPGPESGVSHPLPRPRACACQYILCNCSNVGDAIHSYSTAALRLDGPTMDHADALDRQGCAMPVTHTAVTRPPVACRPAGQSAIAPAYLSVQNSVSAMVAPRPALPGDLRHAGIMAGASHCMVAHDHHDHCSRSCWRGPSTTTISPSSSSAAPWPTAAPANRRRPRSYSQGWATPPRNRDCMLHVSEVSPANTSTSFQMQQSLPCLVLAGRLDGGQTTAWLPAQAALGTASPLMEPALQHSVPLGDNCQCDNRTGSLLTPSLQDTSNTSSLLPLRGASSWRGAQVQVVGASYDDSLSFHSRLPASWVQHQVGDDMTQRSSSVARQPTTNITTGHPNFQVAAVARQTQPQVPLNLKFKQSSFSTGPGSARATVPDDAYLSPSLSLAMAPDIPRPAVAGHDAAVSATIDHDLAQKNRSPLLACPDSLVDQLLREGGTGSITAFAASAELHAALSHVPHDSLSAGARPHEDWTTELEQELLLSLAQGAQDDMDASLMRDAVLTCNSFGPVARLQHLMSACFVQGPVDQAQSLGAQQFQHQHHYDTAQYARAPIGTGTQSTRLQLPVSAFEASLLAMAAPSETSNLPVNTVTCLQPAVHARTPRQGEAVRVDPHPCHAVPGDLMGHNSEGSSMSSSPAKRIAATYTSSAAGCARDMVSDASGSDIESMGLDEFLLSLD